MTPASAQSFAQWLAHDQPELFVALYKRAVPANVKNSLGDFTDVLSSIGTGLSNAVSQVGSFLTSPAGAAAVTSIGAVYLQSQAAKNAVNINYSRAQSGAQAAPIQTVFNPNTGQYEPTLVQATGGAVRITPTIAQTLAPGLPSWAFWSIGGAVLLLFTFLAFRK